MDDLDKKLLTIIQTGFPIASHPYRVLAQQLDITEDEALDRVRNLVDTGIIRKIGPTFEISKLGYASALVAAKVSPDRLAEVANTISELPAVTHNYQRDFQYNLWFTLICPSMEQLDFTVHEIKGLTGVSDMHALPAERVFKIRVNFEF